jgi:cysteinyl-tRNA synthetase
MSKSLGNFFTIRDIAKKYDYEVIRFFMLSAHYRSPINFSDELMEQAKSALSRLYTCIEQLDFLISKSEIESITTQEQVVYDKIAGYKEKFIAAMDDDINTADAISVLFEIVKDINLELAPGVTYSKEFLEKLKGLIRELGGVLGLLQKEKEDEISPEVKELVEARARARKEKNWAEADRIRDELTAMGIVLEDTPQGVKWHR